MKLRLWRNQSIRVNKKAPLLADQNQNAGHQRQDAGHDHGDTDVKESHDSNKDQINGEQKHSEVLGDVHEYFLSQPPSFCTHKIWSRESKICPRMDANQEKGFALPKGPPIGWTRVATATELRETEQKFLRFYSRLLA